jgi:LysR family hydrogen peroxide-inducible transcriptional activator
MHLPTLRQLQYLIAVVELKHFGHAAERCFVTQSTLSAGIQDLETLLGTPLLERTNRKVLPTALGIAIADQARKIISLTTDLVDHAQADKNPLVGRVKVGLIPSISPFLLSKSLPTIRTQMPNLELELIEEQSERLLDQLEAGKVDIAVMAFPYDTKSMRTEIFLEEPFFVAVPTDHPLTKLENIPTDQLPVEELMLLMEGHCLREHALSACQLPSSQQRSTVQGTSLHTLIEMVANGLGITLIPQMALNSDMLKNADVEIRALDSKGNHATRGIGLVWRPSYLRHETIEQLMTIFKAALS